MVLRSQRAPYSGPLGAVPIARVVDPVATVAEMSVDTSSELVLSALRVFGVKTEDPEVLNLVNGPAFALVRREIKAWRWLPPAVAFGYMVLFKRRKPQEKGVQDDVHRRTDIPRSRMDSERSGHERGARKATEVSGAVPGGGEASGDVHSDVGDQGGILS